MTAPYADDELRLDHPRPTVPTIAQEVALSQEFLADEPWPYVESLILRHYTQVG